MFAAWQAQGQQPFITDNAAVTDTGSLHLQFANEIDRLQLSSIPNTYQNGARVVAAFGIFKDVEVSVTGQFLSLVSTSDRRLVDGIGDTGFAVKYNFRKERDDYRLPALTFSVFAQLPTGNSLRSLGSGAVGYGFNMVAEKTIRKKNTVRINLGYLAAGNTLVGNLGIATIRGGIFTGGASLVRAVGEKWQLGAELTGAVSNKFQLSRGQLQTQWGGNYQLNKRSTFDFGLILGRFVASPRYGFLLGYSRDITLRKK